MTPLQIRRQTAEKLAQPAKTSQPAPPANGQRPIEGCVIPAHLRGRLDSIRARCEASVAQREALKAQQHTEEPL